jgi:hypothetical protein
MTTRELAERVMAERAPDISDAALRTSVVFKVVQALRHAKRRKLVRMVERRKGMCVWTAGDALMARASSPVSLSNPANQCRQAPTDQPVRQATVAFLPMIFGPSGAGGFRREAQRFKQT